MDLWGIFKAKSPKLFWQRLPDSQIVGETAGQSIEQDQAYFVVRMREMYVRNARVLWRKFYPVLHGYVTHQQSEEHSIAGPGQLRELGEANLERIVNLNHRLAGPTPYRGGEVRLLCGLYSVPGQDAAKVLINTVGALAGLGGIALGQVPQIAGLVKEGVENVLGLNESTLQMGVSDAFFSPNNPLRSGVYLGVSAESDKVDPKKLWLKNGRLVTGIDPVAAAPYQDHDYMVLAVERRERREDWPGLPGLSEFQQEFAAILASAAPVAEKRKQLGEPWVRFTQALETSAHLTVPDREAIAGDVQQDLKKRLQAIEGGNPFESKSWGETKSRAISPTAYDFLDVERSVDVSDARSRRLGQEALTSQAF
jgi:hypothetical protein